MPAGNAQVPVEALRGTDCPRVHHMPAVQHPLTCQEVLGLRLFRGTVDDAQEVAFAERIMEFFLEIVPELEEACGCDTDKLIGTLIHKPEKSTVFVKICERLAA